MLLTKFCSTNRLNVRRLRRYIHKATFCQPQWCVWCIYLYGYQLRSKGISFWPLLDFRRFCKRFRFFSTRLPWHVDTLHSQNLNQYVFTQFIRDFETPYYLSEVTTTIFKHCFFNFLDVVIINASSNWPVQVSFDQMV